VRYDDDDDDGEEKLGRVWKVMGGNYLSTSGGYILLLSCGDSMPDMVFGELTLRAKK